ncbi:ciliogenesis-associated TTC17-interacting protein isoform X2 [Dendropsophus ebraccatus]|uniref:ciliogenesis-associated TTC17-interacting protein isoform X2 n=1 Tax=Dendropsophus ebraccatus TaxID=150705 RepID=UPI003831CE23
MATRWQHQAREGETRPCYHGDGFGYQATDAAIVLAKKMALRSVEMQEPPEQLRAGAEAVEFMADVGMDQLHLCLFSESLPLVSESGTELGLFTVTVQSAYYAMDHRIQDEGEKCFLVHISSHSAVHGVPCHSSITAYISLQLDTLEQHHCEYMKFKGNSLDKKTAMRRRGDQMEISRVITEGQQVRQESKSYDLTALRGFVSEASNLLIMRLLARRKNPQNLDFLTFDAEMNLCISSYRALGCRPQLIGKDVVDVYGLERAILSDDVPVTWHCHFLPDGHLSSRVQVGSPVTMRLSQMPVLSEMEDENPKPQFEKKPLSWEEDAQLCSEFLERKEVLLSDHTTYLQRRPEVRAVIDDFLQFLLLRKPDDVITFAAKYFGPFSSAQDGGHTFRSSTFSSPFGDE